MKYFMMHFGYGLCMSICKETPFTTSFKKKTPDSVIKTLKWGKWLASGKWLVSLKQKHGILLLNIKK